MKKLIAAVAAIADVGCAPGAAPALLADVGSSRCAAGGGGMGRSQALAASQAVHSIRGVADFVRGRNRFLSPSETGLARRDGIRAGGDAAGRAGVLFVQLRTVWF